MNREQRRAAAKRPKPALLAAQARRQKHNDLAGLRLLDSARPFDQGDTTDQHIKTRAAFERLKTGTGDTDDFDRVAMAINVAKVRALDIDAGLADRLECAQNAMTAVRARHGRTSRFGFDGPALVAVTEAMDAHEAIADASSPLQMRIVAQAVRRSVLKNINDRRKAAC